MLCNVQNGLQASSVQVSVMSVQVSVMSGTSGPVAVRRIALALLLGMLFLFPTRTTQAVTLPLIQNTTSSTVLLADDFESPAAPANPVASTGTWTTTEGSATNVESSTLQAFEGNQSVRLLRPSSTSLARLDGTFTNQTSGTLHAQFMIYVTDPVGSGLPNIVLFNAAESQGISMTPVDNPNTAGTAIDSIRMAVGDFVTFGYSSTLFSAFQTNTWQKWEILHTIGTNTATFSIDGVSDSFSNLTTSSFNHVALVSSPNGSQTFFLDAPVFVPLPVPEPSTLALGSLALTGLGLKSRRRRRMPAE